MCRVCVVLCVVCAEGPPKLTGQSPSTETNRLLCTSFKKVSCQKRNSCNYWHVAECTQFRASSGRRFGDKCAYKHTATPADAKDNSASIAIHIPSNDERQMQLRQDPIPSKTSSSREQVRSQKGIWGPTLGVIQTGSQNQRNQSAPTFDIEWTLSMEEKTRTPALI